MDAHAGEIRCREGVSATDIVLVRGGGCVACLGIGWAKRQNNEGESGVPVGEGGVKGCTHDSAYHGHEHIGKGRGDVITRHPTESSFQIATVDERCCARERCDAGDTYLISKSNVYVAA